MTFVPQQVINISNTTNAKSKDDKDVFLLEKPLEYFITRATDPFVNVPVREEHIQKLCERVNSEIDGATIAINVLGHKIISPDQNEVYYSLQCVDELVRQCGDKVHNRIGKYRFLNQLVKLISPKYLGAQSSQAVKEYAIRLLFSWQLSLRHIPKIKEVYDSLKENGLVTKDPDIPEREIVVVAGSSKCASFEDEEKSKLLKSLLSSGNPEDLQAANRLIKSLVKCEDRKMEKAHKRSSDLREAKRVNYSIRDKMIEINMNKSGMKEGDVDGDKLELELQELIDEAHRLRPLLFQHASEATESGEQELEEILKINDDLNCVLRQIASHGEKNRRIGKNKQIMKIADDEVNDLLSLDYLDEAKEEEWKEEVSSSSKRGYDNPVAINNLSLIDASLEPNQTISSNPPNTNGSLLDDVPFIGYNKEMTPVLPRKQIQPFSMSRKKIEATEVLLELNTPVNEKHSPSEPADLISSPIESLPQFVALDPNSIVLADRDPFRCFSGLGVEALLYYVSSETYRGIRSYVLVLNNYSVHALEDLEISLKCEDTKVGIRLQQKPKQRIDGFTLLNGICSLQLLLCVLPFEESKIVVDLGYSLEFKQKSKQVALRGTFWINL